MGLADQKGAFVSSVNPKGPSKKAGIEAGDVILRFNNIEIEKMTDLPRVVAESDVGSTASVEVWRKNKLIIIEVKLGELPEKTYGEKKTSKNTKGSLKEILIKSLNLYITPSTDNNGVIVKKIEDEESKLVMGDIITELNREKVSTTDSFIRLVNKYEKTGRSSLLLKIKRDDESIWITIKFKDN